MAEMSRRERLRRETIAEIKQHARRQMAEKGTVNISLRAIARAMGLTSPALFHYFPNYDALITALIVDAFNASASALNASVSGIPDSQHRRRLHGLASAYRAWALDHPEDYLLINGTPIPGYHAPPEQTNPAAQQTLHLFMTPILGAAESECLELQDEYPEDLPAYRGLQERWRSQLGIDAGIPVIHSALAGWALLRGLIAVELYGGAPDVMAETFEIELQAYLDRLGIVDREAP